MRRSSTRWTILASGLLAACAAEPTPAPPAYGPPDRPSPQAPPAPQPEKPAPERREEVALSPADVEFWFGARGAPASLGGPAVPPPPPVEEAAATRYTLGPGDVLQLRLPEEPAHDRKLTVAPDGTITLDLVGPVKVEGRTLDEVRAELVTRFGALIRDASPQLALEQARPAPVEEVVVIGPVTKPGRLRLTGQRTLLDALGEAGYGGDPAHLSGRLTVVRSGRSLMVWARHLLIPRDPRWNLTLQPDDVVVVHLPDQAAVYGEVVRPGPLTLPPVGGLPVMDALARAGGLTEKADLGRVTISRRWGARTEVLDLNPAVFGELGFTASDRLEPEPLRAGDTIHVPAGKPVRVFVFGMVENPGLQRHSGRVSLAAAVAQAQPKQFGAVLDEAKLVRRWPQAPEVTDVDLEALLFEGHAFLDVELHDGDVVYVPETALSDVLDVLGRILGPLSGPGNVAGQIISARVR